MYSAYASSVSRVLVMIVRPFRAHMHNGKFSQRDHDAALEWWLSSPFLGPGSNSSPTNSSSSSARHASGHGSSIC
jgi:hypothetical protein